MAANLQTCLVCRRPIELGRGVLFKGFRRSLFAVHQEDCAEVARGAMAAVGRVTLVGAEMVLAAKAPRLLEGVRSLVSAVQRLQASQQNRGGL